MTEQTESEAERAAREQAEKLQQRREMGAVAQGVQRLLTEHGPKLVDGAEPYVSVYRANEPKPGEPEQWHAAIMLRQHIAPTPLIALKALGNTLLSIVAAAAAGALPGETTEETVARVCSESGGNDGG